MPSENFIDPLDTARAELDALTVLRTQVLDQIPDADGHVMSGGEFLERSIAHLELAITAVVKKIADNRT